MTAVIHSKNFRNAIIQKYQDKPVRYAPGRFGVIVDMSQDLEILIIRRSTTRGIKAERALLYMRRDDPHLEFIDKLDTKAP